MIELDAQATAECLRPLTQDARFQTAVANITGERLFLSLFLMGLTHGEGLGQAAVAAIGQEEIVRLVRDLDRERLEEQAQLERTRLVTQELFPEFFDQGHYRHEDYVFGREYYLRVREENRRRLRQRGRFSPLNLHLTTSFGYEIMAPLLYGAVIDALPCSPLPPAVAERAAAVLVDLVRRDAGRIAAVARHNALLAADRRALSPEAVEVLDLLERLTAADYEWTAELAVREIVAAYVPYADAAAIRARIARG